MRGGRSVLREKLNVIYVLLKYLFVTVFTQASVYLTAQVLRKLETASNFAFPISLNRISEGHRSEKIK